MLTITPTITPIPAYTDNYIWLIIQQHNQAVCIDPGEAAPVLDYLHAHGLTLAQIWITHAHADHTAGIAALCETGVHKSESVRLPHLPKHGLDFAEIGRIWQFAEQNGAWNARITGISIEAQNSGGAVTVYQTVAADRYLGS